MSPGIILSCVFAYFALLLLIAWYTSRNANNASYFIGNKASPWLAVAFGLIADSLSGVTFISVPGQVGKAGFSYFQIVLGYVLGYIVIAQVLLPVYYRLNLTSIYSFLRGRFGPWSQKSGSFFFLLSRITGAAARLYIAIDILQLFVFSHWNIPFSLTTAVTILLMLVYTYKGGIKTLVWTDTFQSGFLLLGLVLSVAAVAGELGSGVSGLVRGFQESGHTQIFFWDWQSKDYFWKQFISGAFIAIVMTGLDQNTMQKNLSCRSLRDAQKNLYWFTLVLVIVNFLFLSLGALLYQYVEVKGIQLPGKSDHLFPLLALQHLGLLAAVAFLFGLTAATFSSADSVLTTLTTSFCIDILDVDQRPNMTEAQKTRLRHRIHLLFAAVLLGVILLFKAANSDAVIIAVFRLATFTYGPLLGLFAFGLFSRRLVKDRWVPLICAVSPLVCYWINENAAKWLNGYQVGFELLILNGMITFAGLWLARKSTPLSSHPNACPDSHSSKCA